MALALRKRAPSPVPGSVLSTPPDADSIIQVTVVLTSPVPGVERRRSVRHLASQYPGGRRYLERGELARVYGARATSAERVAAFARRHGLTVDRVSTAARSVVLSGSLRDFASTFDVSFVTFDHPQHGRYRSHDNTIRVPARLAADIDSVLGLDSRPLCIRHAASGRADGPGIDPRDVAAAYRLPAGFSGRGQTIGIVTLGGGYHERDVRQFLRAHGSRSTVIARGVCGQRNAPAAGSLVRRYLDAAGVRHIKSRTHPARAVAATLTPAQVAAVQWTLETTMDVQLAAALAPDARVILYLTPNTERGKYEALMEALTDPDGPDVISCSWGQHEDHFAPEWMRLLDEVFQLAALAGITICYSSGDDGGGAGPHGALHAHFPATSPHVMACGGSAFSLRGGRLHERVWSERLGGTVLQSSGGVSRFFTPEPWWQRGADVAGATGRRGRGVPDVAAKADFAPGYRVRVAGVDVAAGGGTSAAAPLWAALVARLNEAVGANCGLVTPLLYRESFRSAFNDIVAGSTGAFDARSGWDACTGLGTPRGNELLAAIRGGGVS